MKRLGLFAVSFAIACSTGPTGTLRGTELGNEVAAPGEGARSYSTRSSQGGIIGHGHDDAVRLGIERAATAQHASLIADGRLALLAGYLAERIGNGATLPPIEVTRFFAYHLGLPEVTPHVLLVGVPDAAAIESAVADATGQYLRRQRYDAYGATVIEREGIDLVVVALSPRPFSMSDVPRSIDAPGSIPVRGELSTGFQTPVFEVVNEAGAVTRVPAGEGTTIEASLEFPATGQYDVRLVATSTSGSGLVARFPIYVGQRPPSVLRLGATQTPTATVDTPEGVEAALVARIDAMRSAQGLPPLERHDGLVAVARAHSQDMVDHDFFAHQSPTTNGPADRVRAASLSSGLVLENLGHGVDAASIHDGLVASAQNRSNILNRDVTHVGVGVVLRTTGSRREYVVTEMFFRIALAIDTSTAPATLLEQINRARAARSAGAVEIDPNLSRAAATAAQQYLDEPTSTDTDVLDDATASLRRFAIAYRRVGGVLAVVSSIDEAATLEPTFDPTVSTVGIGVAQGNRPGIPPNSIVVVYLLAWSR